MAVLKNGRLVGKVGNLVYREVNGRTIVQSRPRPPKGGFKLTSRNSNFAFASKAASALYTELKDFALNLPARELYSSMVSLLMANPKTIPTEEVDDDWSLVPDSHVLPVERHPNLQGLLDESVETEIAEGTYRVKIPALKNSSATNSAHPTWKKMSEFEWTYILLHYDFETTSASLVDRWTSSRFRKRTVGEPVLIERELADFKHFPISNGLLLLSVGLKLYASSSSNSYLNRPDFNPFVVTGIWKKH